MRILLRHLGNMGDMVFFVTPVLSALKKHYPDSHITFVTSWGYKDKHGRFGKRNQGGHSLHLLIPNPHIDQLIHWHHSLTDLSGRTCQEDGHSIPTWSAAYYAQQKKSGKFELVAELDFGIGHDDDPMRSMYQAVNLPNETYSRYHLHVTPQDEYVARTVMNHLPRPRIALLESLSGPTTRSWDPAKAQQLALAIHKRYQVNPYYFHSSPVPAFQGRPLTLRENIATLQQCDVGIGVLSGPLHFAGAVDLPTLSLYCDHPLHRANLPYFLNEYITNPRQRHRSILGPSPKPMTLLKSPHAPQPLSHIEKSTQNYRGWQKPGRQSTKSCLATITVDEVMTVLADMLPSNYA